MNTSRLFVAEEVYRRYRSEYEALFGALPDLGDGGTFPPLDAQATGCSSSTVDPIPAVRPTCNGSMHGLPGDNAEFDHLDATQRDAVTRVVVNVGKAIGAFERKLHCGPGRFDAWVHGDTNILNESEKRGAALFIGRAHCVGCHSGPFLSDQKFHNVGIRPTTVATVFSDRDDRGLAAALPLLLSDPLNIRGPFSDGDDGRLLRAGGGGMEGAFRTPSLRCVSQRPAFMHTGTLPSLEAVIEFFDRGGDPGYSGIAYPGTGELQPLNLSSADRADLVSFLKALDGQGPDLALSASSP